jgi:hypothetical protein
MPSGPEMFGAVAFIDSRYVMIYTKRCHGVDKQGPEAKRGEAEAERASI